MNKKIYCLWATLFVMILLYRVNYPEVSGANNEYTHHYSKVIVTGVGGTQYTLTNVTYILPDRAGRFAIPSFVGGSDSDGCWVQIQGYELIVKILEN